MSVIQKVYIFGAVIFGIACDEGVRKIHSAFSIPVPSAHEVRLLLNDCQDFTVIDTRARHAVSVSPVGNNPDSDGNPWVSFQWRWIAAEPDSNAHDARVSLLYLDDERRWIIERVPTLDGGWQEASCRK